MGIRIVKCDASMPRNEILESINSGKSVEDVAEEHRDECVANEFDEDFPYWCGEDADCFECWKLKIEKISDSKEDNIEK